MADRLFFYSEQLHQIQNLSTIKLDRIELNNFVIKHLDLTLYEKIWSFQDKYSKKRALCTAHLHRRSYIGAIEGSAPPCMHQVPRIVMCKCMYIFPLSTGIVVCIVVLSVTTD